MLTGPDLPLPDKSRRISIRLSLPAWIGIVVVLLVVSAVVLVNLRNVNQQTLDDLRAGPQEAQNDIRSGKLRYMWYGEPQPHDVLFSQILKADHGITLVHFGCGISEESRIAAHGYNYVINEYLKQKSMEGAIKESEAKARRQWQREQEGASARLD